MLDPILPDKYNVTDCSLSITPVENRESPEVLRDNLYETIKRLKPGADLTKVKEAVELAMDAHKDQRRKSGECVQQPTADLRLVRGSSQQFGQRLPVRLLRISLVLPCRRQMVV